MPETVPMSPNVGSSRVEILTRSAIYCECALLASQRISEAEFKLFWHLEIDVVYFLT